MTMCDRCARDCNCERSLYHNDGKYEYCRQFIAIKYPTKHILDNVN
jgi:hypothetical protein